MERTICIIEDDDGIQDVLRIILNRAGYEVVIFSDGKAIMEDDFVSPDLVLLDKQLPDIDGLTICRHLKADPDTATIPVIMMSAYPNAGELSKDSGADDFIEKPFQIETLLATIKKYITSEAVV